jgi:hypothetical protein
LQHPWQAGRTRPDEALADTDGDGWVDAHWLAPPGTEQYNLITDNPFLKPLEEPLSTFSIDVDTASYSNLRRFITSGGLPPRDAVRIEDLINYFNYYYEPPSGEDGAPFSANVEINAAPWNPEHRLVRIGLRGRDVPADMRPPTSLVFLVDVSGSMQPGLHHAAFAGAPADAVHRDVRSLSGLRPVGRSAEAVRRAEPAAGQGRQDHHHLCLPVLAERDQADPARQHAVRAGRDHADAHH